MKSVRALRRRPVRTAVSVIALLLSMALLAAVSAPSSATGAQGVQKTDCTLPNSKLPTEERRALLQFIRRGDISPLPKDLCDTLVDMMIRPHSLPVLPVFNEADDTSLLFGYYLLDTTEFEENVFTSAVEGINEHALPTGANFANGGLPSTGAIRLIFEPKENLRGNPETPNDPAAFIDVFTDISGLFVINNEAGWYEGWMIRDLTVPAEIAELDGQGVNPWGTMTQADHDALQAASEDGVNEPGTIFSADGQAVRLPSPEDDLASGDIGNTIGFPISIGAFNTLQQSDGHAYWELNPGTNWTFPLYELPFTGVGGPAALESPSIVPPSYEALLSGSIPEAIAGERAALLGDRPLDPRDPDRFEDEVEFEQAESRNRFIPSNMANEMLLDVFVRTESFAPGVGMPNRLYMSYAKQMAKVDADGDGAISFGEADVLREISNGDQTITGRDLYIPATGFNRYAITRELNDGLLAPRFAPTQAAYVLAGDFHHIDPPIETGIPRDADDR